MSTHKEITWEADKNGCHICTSHRPGTHGYPQIRLNRKKTTINRVAFVKAFGPIPEGLHVLHKCDVRMCINPEHLFLGTQVDNMKDMCDKGRHVCGEEFGKTRQGEKNGRAKLSESEAFSIKYNTAEMTKEQVANKFNVSPAQVWRIRSGILWKHI